MTDSLLSRLQSLTEPSREIDAEIALATFPWLKDCPRDDRDGDPGWITKDGRTYAPRYTESLDAALTLVPQMSVWCLEQTAFVGGFTFEIWLRERGSAGHGPTAAIALLIAIMKAKEESK